ncbi:MAG: hemolysin family protein [Candidatus Omnitrophica bacterium]|nr:hemolysin family protein [Candidatus Omnitrophota bacterium]MCM8810812.1 hemolysin family protein [Candidatus Omnitrophota bacterium]
MREIPLNSYLIFLFLIALSSFFSASETAFISLGKHHYQKILEIDKKKGERLSFWFENPEKVLVTTLVGNNFVNILASVFAATISYQYLGKVIPAIIAGIMTFIILIFGEIIPKSIAKRYPEKIALFAAYPLKIFIIIFSPFVKTFLFFSNIFLMVFRQKIDTIIPTLTEEDVKAMISAGEKEGVIEKEEKDMIHSIFELGDKMVKEIMTPRVNIVGVEENTSLEDVRKKISLSGYSRMPVYKENIDKIIGIVYIKDIIAKQTENSWEKLKAKDIIRNVYFVPETKKVIELLRELQMLKLQMAIVIDEYGGTSGLVTMEDLIEEIVGEISDEFKKDEKEYLKINVDKYLIKGTMEIEKVEELLGIEIPEEIDVETIAGFVLANLRKFPKKGESFEYSDYKFTVQDADEKIIKWVKVEKLEKGVENGGKSNEGFQS